MGWWAIANEGGGIDFSNLGKMGLANQVPGTDNNEETLYGGDEPADIMGNAVQEIAGLFKQEWGRYPKMEELKACFNFVTAPQVQEDGTFDPDAES